MFRLRTTTMREEATGPRGMAGLRGLARLRGVAGLRHPGVLAVLTWLVLTPVAVVTPTLADANPFEQRGAEVPLAIGGAAVAVLAVAAWWLTHPDGGRGRGAGWVSPLSGIAVGVLAAYVVLVVRSALHGTPLGIEGVYGDSGRLSAMATRYTTTWKSTDGLVNVPSEYPPLFPFLVGKASVLTGVPAWRLLAPAEFLTVAGSVVLGFVLWLRLTAAPAALAIVALGLASFAAPDKAYEVIALVVVVPWVMMTVEWPRKGALGWLPAGLVGGLLVLTYYAYLAFAAAGLAVLVAVRLRRERDRAYAVHLARTAGVMLVIASWWLVPYAWAMLNGGQQVADMFEDTTTPDSPLTFLSMTPLGVVQLAGVVALLWYIRTAWWARPLAAIALGALAYRTVSFLRWVGLQHSGLFYYTAPLITGCLIAAAVLSAVEAMPSVRQRLLGRGFPHGAGVVLLATVAIFVGYTYWDTTMPVNTWIATDDGGTVPDPAALRWTNQEAAIAHLQQLPDGTVPEYARLAAAEHLTIPVMPLPQLRQTVEGALGKGTEPVTLCWDEQIFAFLPWRAYLGVDRDASYGPVRWPDRYREVTRLSRITDPAAFARASARTRFGRIDVFVLQRQGDPRQNDVLTWKALRVPETVIFHRSQFDPASFTLVDLPDNTTVAIRHPR
jgi:hypothetical protein